MLLAATALSLIFSGGVEAAAGNNGAVAAEHRLASAAGVEILRQGGNAVDAAVAASLVSGVVNPSSSGLGGGGFMVIFDAETKKSITIDYRERAPMAATRNMYVRNGKVDNNASKTGGLAIAVPGEPAGLVYALEKYGKLKPAEVAAPAIRIAKEGFQAENHLMKSVARYKEALEKNAVLKEEFSGILNAQFPDKPRLKRIHLAKSLELFAAEGAKPFYEGVIATAIVDASKKSGGILTAEDLREYRVVEREPVRFDYQGTTFHTMPPPSSGGGLMGAALNVLDGYKLHSLDPQGATYLHLLAETLKAVFADRAEKYGDPDFVDVPIDTLLSDERAEFIRSKLNAGRALPSRSWGTHQTKDDGGTAHISVVDAAGNAVACTTSINTGFGSKVGVPSFGIILNNTMDDFSAQPGTPNAFGLVGSEANSIAPKKRPLSSMSPTIAVKDGHVRFVAGGSGGPLIITGTLQTILNALVFEMKTRAAVAAPRIHHQWMPDTLLIDSRYPAIGIRALEIRKHNVVISDHGAAVQAIHVKGSGDDRTVDAASDPRKGGVAKAY